MMNKREREIFESLKALRNNVPPQIRFSQWYRAFEHNMNLMEKEIDPQPEKEPDAPEAEKKEPEKKEVEE